ncbi:MAG: hypothetical protein AAGU11_22845 [Syntrophobacteraceae bacterium]
MIVIDKKRTFRIGNKGRRELEQKRDRLIKDKIKEVHLKMADERARAKLAVDRNKERIKREQAERKKALK